MKAHVSKAIPWLWAKGQNNNIHHLRGAWLHRLATNLVVYIVDVMGGGSAYAAEQACASAPASDPWDTQW
jgi:hypothetical protein